MNWENAKWFALGFGLGFVTYPGLVTAHVAWIWS
jgi:hypothetical protein